jgi:carbonic anhydrase/acetyltransferase-like protein (isoleucine patch superfamily)
VKISGRLSSFIREPLMEKTETVAHWYWLLKTQLYYRRFFHSIGPRSRIIRPLRLKHVENIAIGREVLIHKYCWQQTERHSTQGPEMVIGDGCVIGNFNHITCMDRVCFGEKVLTADRVFISDHSHQFEDPHNPIMEQGVLPRGPVSIGSGSWLGENVVVVSAHIGRNCVIGANSVVIRNIPDHCVAVGSPARIIRRFNEEKNAWERPSAGSE